ncbi:MAG: pyridoxamine 5'-phosphate oxidase family protein [Alphaproteobacteria bacterium]
MQTAWTHKESPFHAGELAVQEALGVRKKMDTFARKVVRDHLPQEHREFYPQLPFLVLGTVDNRGRPWASLVTGEPGFVSSPDEHILKIRADPLPGDPLNETLHAGADIGILGIQLETRRRNRLAGQINATTPDGFSIHIDQAFGNCPRYIQSRSVNFPASKPIGTPVPRRNSRLSDDARALIERSDTLFIATAYAEESDDVSHGADVSHRGGKPGFVKVEADDALVFPDFSGNNHFNTVGNIVANPKAGMLFADFETGDVVYLSGDAEIVWSGPQLEAFDKAERLIRIRPAELIEVSGGLPLSFDFVDYSPALERTGAWP